VACDALGEATGVACFSVRSPREFSFCAVFVATLYAGAAVLNSR
jgi:hypothetical protein